MRNMNTTMAAKIIEHIDPVDMLAGSLSAGFIIGSASIIAFFFI